MGCSDYVGCPDSIDFSSIFYIGTGVAVELGAQGWLSDWHHGPRPHSTSQDPRLFVFSGQSDWSTAMESGSDHFFSSHWYLIVLGTCSGCENAIHSCVSDLLSFVLAGEGVTEVVMVTALCGGDEQWKVVHLISKANEGDLSALCGGKGVWPLGVKRM